MMKKDLAKKIGVLLLGVSLICSMGACGSGGSGASDDSQEAENEIAQGTYFEQYGIGIVMPEGTTEEKGDGNIWFYKNDREKLALSPEASINYSNILAERYIKGMADNTEDGSYEEVMDYAVDGHDAIMYDLKGEYEWTVTFFDWSGKLGTLILSSESYDDWETMHERMKEILDEVVIDEKVAEEAAKEQAAGKAEEEAEEADEEEAEYYVKKRTAVTKDCTIKITKYEILQPGEGANAYGSDSVIVFHYKMTNNSAKTITDAVEWPVVMDVVQDNDPNAVNTLDLAVLWASDDSSTSLKEIKPGGTISCSKGYTLTDLTTPVTVTVKNGVLGEELGTMTFKLK